MENKKIAETSRKEILSQLLRGAPTDLLLAGYADEERDWLMAELEGLAHHTGRLRNFTRGAERHALWMAQVRRILRSTHATCAIESIRGSDIGEFEKSFRLNKPLVMRSLMAEWPSLQKVTFRSLRAAYGGSIVEYMDRRTDGYDHEINPEKYRTTATLESLIHRATTEVTNAFYMVANNHVLDNALESAFDTLDPLNGITVHEKRPGSLSLWLGPGGTVTPLHFDNVNVLHVVVEGRKKMTLIPPEDTALVYHDRGVYSEVDIESVDERAFPLFKHASQYQTELASGDALLIPVGWWHHVRALEPTVSVSAAAFTLKNDFPRPVSVL
jgi:hypothetical protein